jgi:hypothetical protein
MNGNNKHTYEKKFSEYHPYYISKLEHELFIEKTLSLSKAKYMLLPKILISFLNE